MTVLVTGGAGYIGAHVVHALTASGRRVVVLDDLSTGRADRVPGTDLTRVDLAEPGAVDVVAALCRRAGVTAAVHLAARKRVDESVARPDWYREQNVGGTEHLLAGLAQAGVDRLVLSSTAAVYGSPASGTVDEDAPTEPVNPYGETKLACERLVRDAPGLRSVALRYFNVAGAASPLLRDDTEANLVTIVLARLARGQAPVVLGTDYPTADGTCVRDFVHVADVADAHLSALAALEAPAGPAHRVLNVGTGRGASVREVVRRLVALDGSDTPVAEGPRRQGDPAEVVADVRRISADLGWTARHDLDAILRSAWSAVRQVSPSR